MIKHRKGNFVFWFRTQEHLTNAVLENGYLRYAHVTINVRTNEIVKCRASLENIIDLAMIEWSRNECSTI